MFTFRNSKNTFFPLLFTLFFHTALCQEQEPMPEVVAKGAAPVLISSDFKFTEGPAVDASGNVYFTDQPNDRILKWSPREGITVFMEGVGRSNGLYFDRNGNLIACADLNNELGAVAPDKSVTMPVRDVESKRHYGQNEVWLQRGGAMDSTVRLFKRNYCARTEKEIQNEDV